MTFDPLIKEGRESFTLTVQDIEHTGGDEGPSKAKIQPTFLQRRAVAQVHRTGEWDLALISTEAVSVQSTGLEEALQTTECANYWRETWLSSEV